MLVAKRLWMSGWSAQTLRWPGAEGKNTHSLRRPPAFQGVTAARGLLSWRPMESKRILIVDDEQNARDALRTMLVEDGYEVAEASNGQEALGLLPAFAPAVVLADVRMPKMDGITLLRKAKEAGHDAAFVMMTAFGSIETAVEAMRAGAENFLVKPLDINAVLVVLDKVLEKTRLVRETETLRARVQ